MREIIINWWFLFLSLPDLQLTEKGFIGKKKNCTSKSSKILYEMHDKASVILCIGSNHNHERFLCNIFLRITL